LLLKQVVGRIAYDLLCDLHRLRVSWFLATVTFAQELSSANKDTPQKVICVDFADVVSHEFKDIFEIAIINFVIKLQMPRLWLPMLVTLVGARLLPQPQTTDMNLEPVHRLVS
jgi:hypothetical protein